MNFEGRYYTDNDTLVAVHRNHEEYYPYWGHIICSEEQGEDNKIFYWDENGKCIAILNSLVYGDESAGLHLSRVVNPMTYAYGMTVKGCVECSRWEENKIKHKGGEVRDTVESLAKQRRECPLERLKKTVIIPIYVEVEKGMEDNFLAFMECSRFRFRHYKAMSAVSLEDVEEVMEEIYRKVENG